MRLHGMPGRPRVNMLGTPPWGQLLVIGTAPDGPDGLTRWRCRCLACGSECTVRTKLLHDERRPRTCGCAAEKWRGKPKSQEWAVL